MTTARGGPAPCVERVDTWPPSGGKLLTPHVGKEALDHNGRVVEEISPAPTGRVEVSASSLENTLEGLRMVTAEEGTAGYAVSDSPLPIIGKTGTGEMWGKDPVNWFAGWAEGQQRPLVIVAMVEGGGAFETGSEMTAAPAHRTPMCFAYSSKNPFLSRLRSCAPRWLGYSSSPKIPSSDSPAQLRR